MKKSTFFPAAAAVVLLALASAWAVTAAFDSGSAEPRFRAVWAYRAEDPAQMAQDVDAVVVARAIGVRAGREAQSSNGLDSLAFELNDFEVEQALSGAADGETVTVERVAGGPERAVVDHDGGPYDEGRSYLLFLRKQSTSPFFYLVHPEGRYAVGDDGLLTTDAAGPVATRLYGRSLKEAVALLHADAPQVR